MVGRTSTSADIAQFADTSKVAKDLDAEMSTSERKDFFKQRKEEKIELDGAQSRMIMLNISDVSKNGQQLLCFGQAQTGENWGLYIIDIMERKKIQLTDNNLNEWGAVFSANEKWIAYSSEKDMEGSFAIYLNHFPDMDNEIRISSGGGEEPMWLPGGSSLFYRNGLLSPF